MRWVDVPSLPVCRASNERFVRFAFMLQKFLHMYFQERARRGKTSKGQHGPAEHVEMDEDEEEAFAEEIISK